MNVTHRYESGLCFGLAEVPVPVNGRVVEVSFFFEIDIKGKTANKYSDGRVTVEENTVAEFEYKRTGSLVISSRYFDNIGDYASAIEGAIKDLEFYFKLHE